jgi:hypothetical protein
VDPERLELPTLAFEAQCSIQLSYGSALVKCTLIFVTLDSAYSYPRKLRPLDQITLNTVLLLLALLGSTPFVAGEVHKTPP